MNKQTTLSIITFFVLAFAISFVFSKLPVFSYQSINSKDIICGFGPLISGLICYQIFKTPTTYSITGSQPLKAWLVVLVAGVTFVLTTKGDLGFNLIFFVSQIIYCFGEEFGWRHYLQSATNNLHKWLQPCVIGTVWFAWHYSWLPNPVAAMLGQNMNAPLPIAIMIAIFSLILFTSFLGLLITNTNSVLFPTVIHFILKTNTPTLFITLSLVLIFIFTWDKFKIGQKVSAS
jgi:membrane protease YdiL (CAAX protease family)